MSPLRDLHNATKSEKVRSRIWRWLIIISCLAVALSLYQDRKDDIAIKESNLRIEAIITAEKNQSEVIAKDLCIETRQLISEIILRSLNATYEDYQDNPNEVLERYREMLERSPSFQGNQQAIDESVTRTRDILRKTSPRGCNSA